jgi:hypothetical protein
MAISNPKRFNNATIMKLAQWLKANNANPIKQALSKTFGSDIKFKKGGYDINNANKYFKDNIQKGTPIDYENPSNVLNEATAKTYSDAYKNATDVQNLDNGVTLGQLGKLGMGAASEHPFLAGAGALTTGMNIAGLTDNDKFGGQLGGAALGGLSSYLAGLNPGYAYLATTAGGALGSLFDKLRAKREQEAALAQQYQQGYR